MKNEPPTPTRSRLSVRLPVTSVGLALASWVVGCAAPNPAPVAVRSPVPVYQYPSQAQPMRDYRRRTHEPLYEAPVMSVRAVMGSPQQRCWLEREEVMPPRPGQLPGAVVGGIIGGILGHQMGGGSGRDLATVGGALAGAVMGSHVGGAQGPDVVRAQEVQRCTSVPGSAIPLYWDVSYVFQGITHHVQMTDPPGRTVTVNAQGEPRL